MLSDRGVAPFLRAEELEIPWFGGCDWLHLSGYSLLRARSRRPPRRRPARSRRRAGGSASTSRRRPGIAAYGPQKPARPARASEARRRVRQRRRAGGDRGSSARDARPQARSRQGFTVDGRHYPALDAEVMDTTGAGDALAAGYLVGGPELAAQAAARCVARAGAMPSGRTRPTRRAPATGCASLRSPESVSPGSSTRAGTRRAATTSAAPRPRPRRSGPWPRRCAAARIRTRPAPGSAASSARRACWRSIAGPLTTRAPCPTRDSSSSERAACSGSPSARRRCSRRRPTRAGSPFCAPAEPSASTRQAESCF